MNRTRADCRCPDCKEIPKADANGRLKCACNEVWARCNGEKGTAEEQMLLVNNGFEMAEDVQGDVYYVGPYGHIIWLYSNGEWFGDKAPKNCNSLEEYFAFLKMPVA